jgi:hypothetical protein
MLSLDNIRGPTLKLVASRFLVFLVFGACLFADDLQWGGTWVGVWSGFGTSPYTAIDVSQNNKVLTIFCLDYNDEIAPPIDWQANINALTQTNVDQHAQFGGSYGLGITTTPWAFTTDPGATAGHSVDLTASVSAYTRYQEAAWLFTNIMAAQNNNDLNTMIISQVAAWDLFVENTNVADLSSRIAASNAGGGSTFNNYEYSTDGYTTAPTTNSMTNLLFQDAVDEALNGAQNAVLNQNWYASSFAPSWDLVTGDPNWAASYGRPVQEFLSDGPPVPEPSSILLLATAILGVVLTLRRKMQSV